MEKTSQPSSSAKRARVDSHVDKENHDVDARQPGTKKARLDVATLTIDPYTTLPPPTTSFIQLRFQLARFKGVYRVAKIPLNYTFANLYRLIVFMFGWSGEHTHRARVYSHIEMYSGNYKAGHIKKYGKPEPMPEGYESDELMAQHHELMRRKDIAEYEVVVQGRSTKLRGRNYFGDFVDNADEVVEDQNLCLSQVWNRKLRRNGSKGACTNKEMGIIYEYDLGASWSVHITMDREEDFFTLPSASNLPIMVVGKNKGAPPIEDVRGDVFGEIEGRHKTIAPMFFERDVFEKHLKGEVSSRAGKTALKVKELTNEPVRAAESEDDDDDSDSEDEDGDGGSNETVEPMRPASRPAEPSQALVPITPRAPVPSTSRALPEEPEAETYDDLQDAEGEEYSDSDDEDEDIDEETALAAGLLVAQGLTVGAALMMALVLDRRRH
ncbi:hypothetical protein C8R43DRAFT_1102645 [Mycena crocata]|nr:hypothetical protein C8R43DRAFT_1102645 [Mycena crocata]